MGEERKGFRRAPRAAALGLACAAIGIPAVATGGWKGPRLLSAAGDDGRAPAAASAPDGTTILAWERFDGTQPPSTCCRRIQAVIRRPGGKLGSVKTLSAPGEAAIFPQAAIGPDGTAAVIWRRFDGTDPPFTCCRLAQIRVFRPGKGWGSVQTLSVPGEDTVDVAVGVGRGGRAVAMWTREEGPGHDRRLQARFRAPRNDAKPKFRRLQSLNPPGEDALSPQLGVANDGQAAIVWQRFDGAHDRTVVKLKGERGRFGKRRKLSRPSDESDYHELAVAANGAMLAGWLVETAGSEYELEVARRPPNGKFGRIVQLSEAAQGGEPSLALDNDGRAIVAYSQSATPEDRVAVRAARRGADFGKRKFLTPATQPTGNPRLANAPDGTTVVGWQFVTDPGDPLCCVVVQARVRKRGKRRFSQTRTLSEDGADAGNLSLASGNRGRAVAVWDRFDGSDTRVEAAFYKR